MNKSEPVGHYISDMQQVQIWGNLTKQPMTVTKKERRKKVKAEQETQGDKKAEIKTEIEELAKVAESSKRAKKSDELKVT